MIALTAQWEFMAKSWLVNVGIHVFVQVRLHILLQLDGLAEWMPAMAEQVSAILPSSFWNRKARLSLCLYQCSAIISSILLCLACARRARYATERGRAITCDGQHHARYFCVCGIRWTSPQVLPLVLELGQDIIWRVRRAVMVSVPLLTERMGVSYFEENLLELYLQARTKIALTNLVYLRMSMSCGCKYYEDLQRSNAIASIRITIVLSHQGLSGQRQRGASRRIRGIATTVQRVWSRLVAREGASAYSQLLRRIHVLPHPYCYPQRAQEAGQRRGKSWQRWTPCFTAAIAARI